jgi:hypothetical protein
MNWNVLNPDTRSCGLSTRGAEIMTKELAIAFQIEAINTPELRAEFDAFKFTYPMSNTPLESRRWVVDRERDLYLVNRGGGSPRELPFFFCLVFNEDIRVDCEGTMDAKGEIYPDGEAITWNISSVQIPKSQAHRCDEIMGWLYDALKLYGNFGDPEITKSTRVELPSPVFV